MSRRVVHFLLHVPKCAGTTVEDHFERHLGPGFMIAPRWESVWRNVVGNRYAFSAGDTRLNHVRVVSGHSLSISLKRAFPDADIRESVLLRDPVGYHLSFYNYRWTWHRKGNGPRPPTFARWYAAQRRNPIARFVLNRYFEEGVPALYRLSSAARLAYLEERLAQFWFVGGHRRANELVAEVSRDLGIEERVESRNVTREKEVTEESLGPDWLARITAENALDAALYERWRDRGWGGAPEHAPERAAGAAVPAVPADVDLPRDDRWRYLLGDARSGLSKKLIR